MGYKHLVVFIKGTHYIDDLYTLTHTIIPSPWLRELAGQPGVQVNYAHCKFMYTTYPLRTFMQPTLIVCSN